VAYHGVPDKAYEVFVTALKSRYLEKGLIIPELEDHNPAGKAEILSYCVASDSTLYSSSFDFDDCNLW